MGIGPNGAGKSSTLKMLVGEETPSAGSFRIAGSLGYCPQSDSLVELLSGREHLRFFCKIRGLTERQTRLTVEALLGALSLGPFADRLVGTYSGGNRRKTCVGIAMVGNPSVVLLDEPSTGIDLISRRKMWNFVS